MARITPMEAHAAPPSISKALTSLFKSWGQKWRVVETIANSGSLLSIFISMHAALQKCSLSEDDREVIDLWLAKANGCHYCVPAHILASRNAGMPDDEITAILEGRDPKDPRRRLILKATKAIQETKGGLSDAALEKLQTEGLSTENLFDIIGEIAHCTITNYSNRLAQTDPDDFLLDVKLDTKQEGLPAPKTLRYPLRPPKCG